MIGQIISHHRVVEKLGGRRRRGLIAYDYAALGDKDQTLSWLEKAYSEKAGSLGYLKATTLMDSLRTDLRYIDLLKRIGLPP